MIKILLFKELITTFSTFCSSNGYSTANHCRMSPFKCNFYLKWCIYVQNYHAAIEIPVPSALRWHSLSLTPTWPSQALPHVPSGPVAVTELSDAPPLPVRSCSHHQVSSQLLCSEPRQGPPLLLIHITLQVLHHLSSP